MAEPGDQVLRIAIEGQIARLTISRPEALNALNASVFDALERALDQVQGEPDVRVVIISGDGDRAFCAGADIDELQGLGGLEARRLLGRGQGLFRRVETLGIPTIASVSGWALGGGFELALSCSLIVASTKARFGLPESSLGLIPGYGGTRRLTRLVGSKVALATMLAGLRLDAARAWQLGLLAVEPVEPEELGGATERLAADIAKASPSAVELILESVVGAGADPAGLAHETALAALATDSADAEVGVEAFLAKREPKFAPRRPASG